MKNSRQSLDKIVDKIVGKCVKNLTNTGAARALILACLVLPLTGAAADATLILASDLRREAAEATQAGQPLLILYSRQNCTYCAEVRNSWLVPLSHDSRQSGLQVRQIDQDSDRPLIDFAGHSTTHARFAATEKIAFVPVVAVYDARGQHLAEAIVGLRLRDFYGTYLDALLDKARLHLHAH